MRLFGETHFDILGMRRWAAMLSCAVILISIVSLVIQGGPRLGIDFAGGSQIVVRFSDPVDLNELRQALMAQGLEGSQIQEFEGEREVLIRTPRVEEGEELAVVESINSALEVVDPAPAGSEGKMDLNTVGVALVTTVLLEANPMGLDVVVDLEDTQRQYQQIAQSALNVRAAEGLLSVWDQVIGLGYDAAVVETLQESFYLGGHHVVNTEWVGPQVGQDLRRQTLQAMGWALLGLLAYITYRFEFRFGVAAVVALVHDVLIALGAFSLTGREFNLPVIAAFLTIIGYSLNDTVVVFDRIRENNQVQRRLPLYDRINLSINQTLSRTVLTSGTTLLVVISLFLYGGPVINNFSFALLVGVLVGTYSSIFVASPIVYAWYARAAKRVKL
jgi:preprotein translocase subunit SecF